MSERNSSRDPGADADEADEHARQLARLHAFASRVSGAMLRLRDARELAETACRLVIEERFAILAWVGMVGVDGDIEPIARHGRDAGYVDLVRLHVRNGPTVGGPATKALATGRVSVSNDIESDADFFWRDEALRRGQRSCAVFPLRRGGRPAGIFALLAGTTDAFGADEVAVLGGLAENLGFAMEASHIAAERDQLLADMTERVKELTLVHRVARELATEPAVDRALLDVLVSLFPSAWKAVARCRARITWDGLTAENAGFRRSAHHLVEPLRAAGREGAIEVVYLDDPPGEAPPFLDEERELLRSIADLLSSHLARRHAEEERRRALEQLHQAQKMDALGRLAGGVAHDLNNLLAVILTSSSLLEEDGRPGDPSFERGREIGEAGQRATELVRQLLAFSRQQPVVPRVVDLHRVVAGLERLLRRTLRMELTLVVDAATEPAWVLIDPTQLEQIVLNLVVNARDAVRGAGTIVVATRALVIDADASPTSGAPGPGRWATLTVTDTGEGMDEATRGRIFEPFFTTKELGRGTGLGLSTVYGIAHQAGGGVSVESTPGVGTTFVVYLPSVPAPGPSAPGG